MSRYVVDSSVALKWVLKEPDSPKALALRDQYLQGLHELLVPDIFPIEVGHALAKAERRKIIHPPDGLIHLTDVLAILPPVYKTLPLLPRAYEIASAARIGVYDCLYVALAEREQCEFVTADQRLIANLHKDFPLIVALDTRVP